MRKSSSTVRANANRLSRDALREAFLVLTPPPKMTISEWADDRRFLSPESAAEPGKWNTGRSVRLGHEQGVLGVADHAYCGNCGSRDVETRPNWPTVGVVTQHSPNQPARSQG